MKPDKQPPIAPGQPPLANSKPKKWANVRRKFALIVASRTPAPTPEGQTALSQAENFCRPYRQDPSEPGILESEPDREFDFAQITRENSARNKEITSPMYSAPKATVTSPAASGQSKKKKKKNPHKTVRFIEEPYTIPDQEDRSSIEAPEAEAPEEEELSEAETPEEEVPQPRYRAGAGRGMVTVRVVQE